MVTECFRRHPHGGFPRPLTAQQTRLARLIAQHVPRVLAAGGGDAERLQSSLFPETKTVSEHTPGASMTTRRMQ
jgi:hypothetical protein